VRRHALTAAIVIACLAVGTALLLLALDVSRLETAFANDDVRYRAAPEETVWEPTELLPAGLARGRRALRGVRLSHPETPGFSDPAYVVHRNEATAWLIDVVQRDNDDSRRSAAANLLGILSFADAIADYENRGRLLEGSAGRFRQAIGFDPRNEDAKFNLELTLSRSQGLELTESGGGTAPSPGGKGARGAGAGDPGSGY
jgi:hypothetical protein